MARLTILITAGPTREYLDPVRFFSNASSGKMGYALAQAALGRGHKVVLVSGQVTCEAPKGATLVSVVSAQQMYTAMLKRLAAADIVIGAAAVADYRPAAVSKKKLKKGASSMTVRLVPTPDIIAAVGKRKGERVVVGFALESHNLFRAAEEKLRRKNLDMIVANTPEAIGSAMTSVWLLFPDAPKKVYALKKKTSVAERIIDEAVRLWQARQAHQALS